MKGFSLIFLAICIAFVAATEPGFEPLVVGGRKAKPGQFPYQVSLRSSLLRSHFCGASILTNRFLLTAAHCTTGLHSFPFMIVAVVGAVRRHFDGVTYRLNKVMRHEEFSMSTISNDIALLRTAKGITFTANIQPIALPKQNDLGNTQVMLSGWGKTNAGNFLLPTVLQYAPVVTLSHEECSKRFQGTSARTLLKSYNICAMDKQGVGACNGDSGGPLADTRNKVLLGIVSWGIPCGKGFPDAYTRVYSYLDWILKHMNNNYLDNQ